ncbi:AlpA family transcriptional regulator [Aeromonas enteropelogenes]|uniref:helix-turn-helix transcriptional regulator n=1 Tax=Aeromonas enteropelogenes TaxID=29489 RepID=UPI00191CFEF5|nr:AlpA family transcriptional regulator [Aeromonas enteropelogenes]MBL0521104.1 AlpA family transcriptional regulator [Aeromonas enteropelogenes]
MEQHAIIPTLRFIRVREAIKKTGLSKSSIYDLMARGQFPQTIHLGGRTVAFVESEVEHWMAERIAARNEGVEQ